MLLRWLYHYGMELLIVLIRTEKETVAINY
jgi:hypothetical protein